MDVRSEVIEQAPLVAAPISVIVDWLEIDMVPGAANVNVEIWVVPNASIDGGSVMDMNDDCDDGDYPKGLTYSNGVMRSHVVDEQYDGGS